MCLKQLKAQMTNDFMRKYIHSAGKDNFKRACILFISLNIKLASTKCVKDFWKGNYFSA